MKSCTILCSLALAVLSSNASSHAALQTNPTECTGKEELQKPKMESAEVKWRVVGLRPKSTAPCPGVPDWQADDWLDQTLREPRKDCRPSDPKRPRVELSQLVAAAPLLHDLGLDRFCTYTYTGTTNPPPPFPKSLRGLVSAANSQMAMVPAGEIDLEPAQTLAQHFLAQSSGMPAATPPPKAVNSLADPQVRLVFIDTQEDGEGVPSHSGPSKHGYTLVHLASELVCQGNDPCRVELATRLALSHTKFNKNNPPADSGTSGPGGNLGLVDELAAAIVNEVVQWRPDSKHKHLILNLSLGWDGEMLGEIDQRRVSQLKPDAQLVYNALQFARQSGALVIAAAGNRRGGEESKWPLLPAAWELRRPSYCPFFGHKLVYAVGGVDWQGLPLPNYRRGGLPKRVAFGDHATAKTGPNEDDTAIYTGSSVSTAVVSSIAAAVWQLRPELKADQVMKLLDRSGNVQPSRSDNFQPSRSDYYAWRDLWPFSKLLRAPRIERLSLCQAVARARVEGGLPSVPKCQAGDPKAANLSALVPDDLADTISFPALTAATLPPDCLSASNPAPQFFAASPPTEAGKSSCPLYLLPDIISQRWVAPQPDDPPCMGCSFVPPPRTMAAAASVQPQDYVLAIQIDPQWATGGASIQSAALDVDRYSQAGLFVGRTTYAIPNDFLTPLVLHRLLVRGVGLGGTLSHCTATLNFQVTVGENSYSVQNPVYVDL
ncbi:MAG TPA: S8/S53 family peptidase [Thermoanaerobaculia bacterium]|jgi:hypothetical protein|nr:S8/S53 family peptidase [Thermoanaerobaculia bacterium]